MDFLALCRALGLRGGNFEKRSWLAGLKRVLRFWRKSLYSAAST